MDGLDGSQAIGSQHFDNPLVPGFGMMLDADLADYSVFLGGSCEHTKLTKIVCERLLAVDVKASTHRGQGVDRMSVVGRTDDDSIKMIFPTNQLSKVAIPTSHRCD